MNFIPRQLLNWLQLGTFWRLPERAIVWPDYFNNCDGLLEEFYPRPNFYYSKYSGKKIPFKGRAEPIDPKVKTHICAHITAVEFGTSVWRRRYWKKQMPKMPKVLLDQYHYNSNTIEQTAERLALHERFWRVPYHFVGLLNGDVLYNNQINRYTYHGNGANGPSIGLSAEANLPALEKNRKSKHSKVDEFFIETNRAAFDVAVLKAQVSGAPLEYFGCHRQYSGRRRGDPGEFYWREIGKPMAQKHGLKIDYEFRALKAKGLWVPIEWDEDANYDYWGNVITHV